jgi:hypothetical protein
MSYPKSMNAQNPHRMVHEAELLLLMPDANALTRELTAAILESRGLLDAQATVAALSTTAIWQKAFVCQTQAAMLRHEVQQLCTQAFVLRLEAEELCNS